MKVIVSAPLPGDAPRALAAEHTLVVGPAEGLGRAGVLAMAAAHPDACALIPLVSDAIDAEVLAAFPALRVVANYGVGVDNIDVASAHARGIVVTNTPDVLTEATADLAFGLLLAVARRIPEGDRLVRAGAWRAWSPELLLGARVAGATLGIVGLGRIGRAVARRARGFAMRVLATTRSERRDDQPGVDDEQWVERVPLERLLAESDFVSLHCGLNAHTRGLVDAVALARMKRSAVLVNTARGAIVDERALAAALGAGTIAGAGLDVFADEPRVAPELLTAPNTVLLPHVGSASRDAREAMAALACQNARAVLAGRAALTPVTPTAGGA